MGASFDYPETISRGAFADSNVVRKIFTPKMESQQENRKHDAQPREASPPNHGIQHEERNSAFIAHLLFNENELLKELLRDDIAEGM